MYFILQYLFHFVKAILMFHSVDKQIIRKDFTHLLKVTRLLISYSRYLHTDTLGHVTVWEKEIDFNQ